METRTGIADTPLLSAHRAEGAKIGEFSGVLLPETFSALEAEYRAGRDTVALFDTNWHLTARFTGRDRVKYLHAITSGNVKDLATGQGTLALLLNPQGRILADLEIYALAESILLRSHVSLREQTLATLRKYILGSQVKLEDISDSTGSAAIEGSRAPTIVQKLCGLELENLPEMSIVEAEIGELPCQLLKRSRFGSSASEFIVGRESLPALWEQLLAAVRGQGGAPIGMATLNSLRLAAGFPWFPADFNDSMIPHEASVETTHVSFNKGCYTGQEIVERVRSQGRVNRKRLKLKFSSPAPPPPGTKLYANGAEVGFITSSAYSPDDGVAIGMGYLRRDYHTPGSIADYEGGTAQVIE
jgi:folate-binding protein YgfZ